LPVRLIYNQVIYDKEIDVRQTVQQFKKFLHEIFHIPLSRLRVFYIDDVAFNMGVCGPEELKYPQRLLHTYVDSNYRVYFSRKSNHTCSARVIQESAWVRTIAQNCLPHALAEQSNIV
jgi:hypothetical protein